MATKGLIEIDTEAGVSRVEVLTGKQATKTRLGEGTMRKAGMRTESATEKGRSTRTIWPRKPGPYKIEKSVGSINNMCIRRINICQCSLFSPASLLRPRYSILHHFSAPIISRSVTPKISEEEKKRQRLAKLAAWKAGNNGAAKHCDSQEPAVKASTASMKGAGADTAGQEEAWCDLAHVT